jgi:catechol 2,3-dioxygenase-like lactoylglutathione lyase family enzyme
MSDPSLPSFRQVVLDAEDARGLAEFYRRLMGLRYQPSHETPDPDGDHWLVLYTAEGLRLLAVQAVDALPAATWPTGPRPQQLHLDLSVPDRAALDRQDVRARELGARLLEDRSADVEEPLRVYADPAGHPFCIFVLTEDG